MNKAEQKKAEQIAKDAMKTFGLSKQRDMLVEECSELIMAVQKLKRAEDLNYNLMNGDKKKNAANLILRKDNFLEEQVDVVILIMQFYLSSDKETQKRFDDMFDAKLIRLGKRITDYKKGIYEYAQKKILKEPAPKKSPAKKSTKKLKK